MSNYKDIKKRYYHLIDIINENNLLYHTYDNPKISDTEYDNLCKELQEIEHAHPSILAKNSPTQKVGSIVLDSFNKVKHDTPMLSLANASDSKEFEDFYHKLCSLLGVKKVVLFAEPKFDGLAVNLNYKNGIFYNAITRGDGIIGEDVSENVRTIKTVPLNLETEDAPGILSFRGEIFIDKKDFATINKNLDKNGEKIYSNPRNLAAGSIRQLDSKIAASRKLKLFIHGVASPSDFINLKTHNSLMKVINSYGLPVNNFSRVVKNISESLQYFDEMNKARDNLPYEIDGLVYRLNDLSFYNQVGFTSKYPKWAVAYKFKSLETITQIIDVSFQVGRTGTITPVAELEPVNIGGVIVSRATLHNFSEIESKDIQIGDYVYVKRAGDVIPDIDRVEIKRRKKVRKIVIPNKCPSCKSELTQIEGQVAYRCLNSKNCVPQIEQSIIHFISRKGANVIGLGDQIIRELIIKKIIQQSSDLYKLTKEDFKKLKRTGEKSIENYLSAIEKSKVINFDKFIYARGIKEVGEASSKSLSKKFSNIQDFLKCNFDDLLEVNDIGPIVAENIINYLEDKDHVKNIINLLKNGIKLSYSKNIDKNISVVITGSLESYSRNELKEKLQSLGYKVSDNVSKNTNILICGKNPGSKKDKALKQGVKIISEKDILKLL